MAVMCQTIDVLNTSAQTKKTERQNIDMSYDHDFEQYAIFGLLNIDKMI